MKSDRGKAAAEKENNRETGAADLRCDAGAASFFDVVGTAVCVQHFAKMIHFWEELEPKEEIDI